MVEVQGFSLVSQYRDCAALNAKCCPQRIFNESVGSPQPWHLLKTRAAENRNLIKFTTANPTEQWKAPLAEEGNDGRFRSHPGPGEGWIPHPGVRSKRGTPSRAPEALLPPQTRTTQVVSASRKRPLLWAAVRGAHGLGGLCRPDPATILLGPAAGASAPACSARPRRAHENAGIRSRGRRGVRGARDLRPRSGQAARRRGAGAQGGARAEQGRPAPRSAPPLSPPPAGGRQGPRPPRPVGRARATPSAPGGGLWVLGWSIAPTLATQASVSRPSRGPRLTSVRARPLCPGPGRGAGGPCGTEGERRESGGRAAGPLGRLDSFTASTPRRQPHAGTLPPAQPPPPGGRPPLRVTHQEHTPRRRPSLGLAHTPPITPPWVLYPLTRTF